MYAHMCGEDTRFSSRLFLGVSLPCELRQNLSGSLGLAISVSLALQLTLGDSVLTSPAVGESLCLPNFSLEFWESEL